MTIIEAIGWLGAGSLLVGFVLNIFQKIAAGSFPYLLPNLGGSALLLYNAYMNGAYPFVVVNLFWVVFSGIKLFQLSFSKS